jgi:hypothetical protein
MMPGTPSSLARHQGRQGRITAEVDHGRGLQLPHQIERHYRAIAERDRGKGVEMDCGRARFRFGTTSILSLENKLLWRNARERRW